MAEHARQKNDTPLYNSRILNTYLKLLRQRYRYINIDNLLASTGIEPHQVADEGHWFTQEQMDRFHNKMNELCGAINIAREAGIYSASAGNLGMMRRHLFSLTHPAALYKMIGRLSQQLTRSSKFVARSLNSTTVEITVTPEPGVQEKAYQCENRLGFFDAISGLYNYRFPTITHDQCIFRGDDHCRYIIRFQQSQTLLLQRIRNGAAILMGGIVLVSLMTDLPWSPAIVVPASLLVILSFGWAAEFIRGRELDRAMADMQASSEADLDIINESYNNSLLVNEIGNTLGAAADTDGILTRIVDIMQNRLSYDRGVILLPNPEHTRLVVMAGYGYSEALRQEFIADHGFHMDQPRSKGMFIRCFQEQKSFLIDDIDKIKDDLSPRSREFLKKSGAHSFVCCPITCEGQAIGILAVDNVRSRRPLRQSDLNLLQGIASQIGISIFNIRLKNRLVDSQKMESIGRLAGGIAHDFNNILATVMSYSSMGMDKTEEGDPVHGYLKAIRKACQAAENLTRQLLIFSRGQTLQARSVDLNQVIKGLISMLDRMAGDRVMLNLNTDRPLPFIHADPGQLEQVLMNLTVNARDAMPDGGTLSIETAVEKITAGPDHDHLMVRPGDYVRMTVTDTGCGIEEKIRHKIFEPFFTTKKEGRGTGLGLATVYGIVKQHRGYIHLDSELQQGATFNIYLPTASG